MKRCFLCVLLSATCFVATTSFAQNVAINEDGSAANPNAILDLKSFTKGILIPRLSTSGRLAIPNTKGLLVFDSTAGSFFFNTGAAWQNLAGGSGTTGWLLNGNSGINSSNQFIGTTDNQPLRFRVNNTQAGELNPANGNIFWGLHAGQSNTSGFSNIAIGTGALQSNVTNSNLVAIGDSALFNDKRIRDTSFIEGALNTAIGSKCLFSNTSGSLNTAVGYRSLFSNTEGFANTAAGHQSLYFNIFGVNNNALGDRSLFFNTNGSKNTAIGSSALLNNTTGSENTAVGDHALAANTGNLGQFNTAVGRSALSHTSSSQFNTAIGYLAGANRNMGFNNALIGAKADVTQDDLFNCVALGESATCTASNQVRFGNTFTTSIGGFVGYTNLSDGRFKKNIQETVKGIDFIMKLRPVMYEWDMEALNEKLYHGKKADEPSKEFANENEKKVFSGFVAQEVEQAAKDA